MIIIHEGVPGSGKSYDSVRKIIDALKNSRIVYTNIDGVNSDTCREALSSLTGLTRDALSSQLIHLEHGQITSFWSFCEPGSFIVIDEAQLYFNSRDWSKTENREFGNWASTHRHHGYDLLLITQRSERIDSAVRSLAEFRYRYRKLNIFGNMVKKGYLVYTYCGDDTKPLGSPYKRTYQSEIFPCYQSYQGDASEKRVVKNPNIFKHPIFYFAGFLLVAAIWSFSKSSFATGDPLGYNNLASKIEAVKRGDNADLSARSPGSQLSVKSELLIPDSPVPKTINADQCLRFNAYVKLGEKEIVMVNGIRLPVFSSVDLINRLVYVPTDSLPQPLFDFVGGGSLPPQKGNGESVSVSVGSENDPQDSNIDRIDMPPNRQTAERLLPPRLIREHRLSDSKQSV